MISFGGLASGLDTGALIDGLVGVERARASSAEQDKKYAEQRMAVVKDIEDGLDKLSEMAKDMDSFDEIRSLTSSSTSDQVKVTQGDDAMAGTYDLSVLNLARAETSRSFAFADDAAGAFTSAGTLGITVGSDTEVQISYDSTMSLTDLATAINNSDARVNATVLFDGTNYRLNVSAQDSGTSNAVSFTDDAGLTGLTDAGAEMVAAEDAVFVINGTTVTRNSDVVDDAIAGVTLELLSDTVSDAQIKVSDDTDALRDKMQGYVDAYNNVASMVERQLTLTGDRANKGSLFGDGMIQRLQQQLADVTSNTFGTDGKRLADFGIELEQTGSLSLDASKFDAAVASGPDELVGLLEGVDGLSQAFQDLADVYTDSVDGLLSAKKDSIQSLMDRLDRNIEDINDGADDMQARLTAEYASLEELMSQLQSQSSALSSMLSSL